MPKASLGGQGKHFSPSFRHFLDQGCCCTGVPPPCLPMPLLFIWPWSLCRCCILWTFHNLIGRAPPPQLVNQTGGFHSADGTDPPGGVSSALDIHSTVPLPFGLSICCISFMGGAFLSCHFWASSSGPPPLSLWSFHLMTSKGGLSVHDNHMLGPYKSI
jgi:hypothetical protein